MQLRKSVKIFLLATILSCLLLGVGLIFPSQLKEHIQQIICPDYVFGIDVSHHQGHINWQAVSESHHPIDFVFVRATVGKHKDKQFRKNWEGTYIYGYIRGAYHYFQPRYGGKEQFLTFSKNVSLKQGDLPPVLDVEYKGRKSAAAYRKEVLIWLKLAEQHYKIKPIVYTGYSFYNHVLKGHINGYPLWIANYSGKFRLKKINWTFHQLTDKVTISGIKGNVDGDDFNGSIEDLEAMCLK